MAAGVYKSESIETLTNIGTAEAEAAAEDEAEDGIWGAADRGDEARVRELLERGVEVNARNCLGCVPLMYAAGSGHLAVVRLLLAQPGVCVNIRNNDRLTCFMLAMQVSQHIRMQISICLLDMAYGSSFLTKGFMRKFYRKKFYKTCSI